MVAMESSLEVLTAVFMLPKEGGFLPAARKSTAWNMQRKGGWDEGKTRHKDEAKVIVKGNWGPT